MKPEKKEKVKPQKKLKKNLVDADEREKAIEPPTKKLRVAKKPTMGKEQERANKKDAIEEVTEQLTRTQSTSVSLWTEYLVAEPVRKALGELNFIEPTPIQKLVMPSAIRDRLDIVGAAETVRILWMSC